MEMQILENRIKHLKSEEERMHKQINKAERHAQVADEIRQRRIDDMEHKEQ